MKISAQDTLLFIGDSITDCGRSRPVGERDGLGDGYVNLANSLLATCHPETCIRVLNTGHLIIAKAFFNAIGGQW